MDTTHPDLDITATTPAGNQYREAIYVDPFPGRKGSEKVHETCGKCGGDGVVHYGNVTLKTNHASGRVCFHCMGRGKTFRFVSSARATARRQVQAENERRAAAADYAATADERAAAEYAQAWDDAHAEQARRDALVKGYVAEIGVRVRGLLATVTVAHWFDTADYYGRPNRKCLVILEVQETGQVIKTVMQYCPFERGALVKVTGTVKDHAEYQGQEQTVLQRVKLEAGE